MKRGFTLIEMLGILVVLSVIILVSLPSIIQTNRNSKQSELKDAEKTIIMAAETYIGISDVASQNLEKNKYYYVKLTTLVTEGLLPSNMKNPKTNLEKTIAEGNYWVEARINNGETIYTLVDNNPYEGEASDSELVYNILLEKGEVVRDKLLTNSNRYVYNNSNPNNYVRFNNQTWRIVALEADKTIKIVMDDFLDSMGASQSEQNVAFGTASTVSSSNLINTYLNNYFYNNLSPNAQNMIVSKNFQVGTIKLSSLGPSSNINTLESNLKYQTKVGLLSPSDYVNASTNSTCSAFSSYSAATDACSENNYLIKSERWWLMHADSSGFNLVINPVSSNAIDEDLNEDCTSSKGKILTDYQKNYAGLNNYPSQCLAKVRPAVYLTKDITITSGNGNVTNPYVFSSI